MSSVDGCAVFLKKKKKKLVSDKKKKHFDFNSKIVFGSSYVDFYLFFSTILAMRHPCLIEIADTQQRVEFKQFLDAYQQQQQPKKKKIIKKKNN